MYKFGLIFVCLFVSNKRQNFKNARKHIMKSTIFLGFLFYIVQREDAHR